MWRRCNEQLLFDHYRKEIDVGSFRAFFVPALIAAHCSGCVSIGSDMATPEAYEQIVEGKTTTDQAFEILGKPNSTTQSSDGMTIYAWSRTSSGPFGANVQITIITLEYRGELLVRKTMSTTET